MAVVFAVRGTSKTAYYAGGYATPYEMGSNSVDAGSGTGIIGDSVINLDQGAFAQHALIYEGLHNLPTGQKMSVLIRFATGSTGDVNELFYVGGIGSHWGLQSRLNGAAQVVSTVSQKDTGVSLLNSTQAFTYATATYYDLVWLIDGTLTTGAYKLYKDGSLLTTSNTSATRAAMANQYGMMIGLGTQNNNAFNQTRIKINEFVIWDEIIDPTNVALVGGNGSLNGSSRTAFVDVTNFNWVPNTYSRGRVVNAGN